MSIFLSEHFIGTILHTHVVVYLSAWYLHQLLVVQVNGSTVEIPLPSLSVTAELESSSPNKLLSYKLVFQDLNVRSAVKQQDLF